MKENETHIVYIINSMINKPGNIGFRIGKIIDESDRMDNKYISVFARGGDCKKADEIVSLGVLGHFARVLTAIKIYIYSNLRVRRYDRVFFELMFFILGRKLLNKSAKNKIAHVIEYSPYIIKSLKKKGYFVILDAPMAPNNYVKQFECSNDENLRKLYLEQYDEFMYSSELESFSSADLINVPSDFVRSELLKVGVPSSKIKLIPFGADTQDSEPTNIEKEGVDFVFAGQLSKRKGLTYLLEAWDSSEFRNDRLHLCGRIRPEIMRIIQKKGLNNVITPGFVNTKSYFSSCDVYVFPSLWEGSSKSIYEAMSSGLPTITTFESGSIIKDGIDGFIIDKSDPISLKEKMVWFKSNPEMIKKMSDNARLNVAKYPWSRYSTACHKLYDEIAHNINS